MPERGVRKEESKGETFPLIKRATPPSGSGEPKVPSLEKVEGVPGQKREKDS